MVHGGFDAAMRLREDAIVSSACSFVADITCRRSVSTSGCSSVAA
jgi:hypothetical protein